MYKVKRSKAGLGLFATAEFKRGDRIIEYKGPRIPFEEASDNAKYLMAVTDDLVVDGKGRDNTARYINHSCKPNAEALISRKVFIYARRRIKPGEEITIDYGSDYWETFIKPKGCRCEPCTEPSLRPRSTSRARA
jgi:SET domain-containing protein